MEDSHIAHIGLSEGISLFGVFDGHGGKLKQSTSSALIMFKGKEVALFVKKHFARELVKLASYKGKDYRNALG